ncbi:VWA domain-containing protein [candidate division KSB1 bacterium]|nr:VWA domain-containing protein [candidate division KSB1 bacterium]RQW05022.1 MAG: VWA domain-containing protein [candidate division KSB1 bacterium]
MMKKWAIKSGIVLLLAAILWPQHTFAIGTIFSRPLWETKTYNKMWIKTVDANTTIEGQIATTVVHQVFRNEMNTTVEAVWLFPLPENAVVVELQYEFNGKWYKGAITERQEARQEYEERLRWYLDPALLEYMGDNMYRLSIAPINANSDVQTKITYVELLPYEFGVVDFTFKLNAVQMSPKPLQRVSFSGVFKSDSPFTAFRSPTHEGTTAMSITKDNPQQYTVIFGDENFMPDKDLQINFETRRDDVEMNVIRYSPTAEDSIGTDSYYAIWILPPDDVGDDQVIPKKIVFTADVSSSMEGERIEQLKQALQEFFKYLQTDDMFNIITFGTTTFAFKEDLVAASPENLEDASRFVTEIGALGLTDIDTAMRKSLEQSFSEGYANMIVFMTDGHPTWGETGVPTIVDNIKKANTKNVKIFSFGVGEDVSKPLLVQMSTENGGYAEFIAEDDDIAKIIGNHFKRISKPVLTDLDIKIPGLSISDPFPKPLADLFWGSQVRQMGIYKNAGTFPVFLTASIGDKQVSYESQGIFPDTPGGHRFVPRLWAKAKIDHLLDEIAIYGELNELVDQVIELSLKFQILTPYTSFYADPTVIRNKSEMQPEDFVLFQNYPNPFNPSTTITFHLPENGFVTLKIFDLTGRLVCTLLREQKNAGFHVLQWFGTDASGQKVAAGVYLYQIEFTNSGGEMLVLTKKMSLVK